MHGYFDILMTQDVCVEQRDQIQIYYLVYWNETYRVNLIFMLQHSNLTDRVNCLLMTSIFSHSLAMRKLEPWTPIDSSIVLKMISR